MEAPLYVRNWSRRSCSILVVLLVLGSHAALARAGTAPLVRNWSVSNPNFSDAELSGMFVATNPADGDSTIPLKVNLIFSDFTPIPFTFTNSFTKAAYTGPPNNGSLTASVNAYSKFLVDFVFDNATGAPWTGFVFDIKDNVPGRPLVDGFTNHPATAHFHAPDKGTFEKSLAPFTVLTRVPTPDINGYGFATAIASGGVLAPPDLIWTPMGLVMHNNISFNADGKNQTSFTLTLNPVPEPASVVLLGVGVLCLYGWRLRINVLPRQTFFG